jgi:acyl-CoA reductase-like NAD-dependent aldehyde dehydrogenase
VPCGLAAPVHNRDLSVALKMMEQIASGIVYIHVGTIAARWKSAYIDYCRRLLKAQIGR